MVTLGCTDHLCVSVGAFLGFPLRWFSECVCAFIPQFLYIAVIPKHAVTTNCNDLASYLTHIFKTAMIVCVSHDNDGRGK